ncbi:MAG: hypothetical protein RIB59_03025 [Rhodospirillales bacterium]
MAAMPMMMALSPDITRSITITIKNAVISGLKKDSIDYVLTVDKAITKLGWL